MAADEQAKGFRVSDRRFWADGQGDGKNGADTTAGEPGTPSYPSYVEQLRAELAEKDQQLRSYIAAYKEQVVKGIDDTKERLARESERELARLRGRLVEDLLEVLDNLDRSLDAAQAGSGDPRTLSDGVRLVRDQFRAKLGALGLAPLDAAGARFDPSQHEAVAVAEVSDPAQDGQVIRVIQPGYRMGDRVLRPALVQVGRLSSAQR
jgi:molecular chaperone GrpE